jgi:hypothetical protein
MSFLCFLAFLSSCLSFWLDLPFSCLLLVLHLFLLLDDLLEFFVNFWSSSYA